MPTPVTIVTSGGIPVTQAAALTALGAPMTVVTAGGIPATLADSGGYPVVLMNEDGTLYAGTLTPPSGFAFVTDDNAAYITDDNGAYVVAEAS